MKKLLLIIVTVLISASTFSQETEIDKTNSIYWLGIDYNHCYFITSYDFPTPSELKNKLGIWNVLVFNEKEKYIDNTLSGMQVTIASKFISSLNDNVDIENRLTGDLSKARHLKKSDIYQIVKEYDFPSDLSGVGLILIAESYSKPEEKGYYYVTFIDIKSKKVLSTERVSGKARGFGLRNYWAHTYYKVLKQVGKNY